MMPVNASTLLERPGLRLVSALLHGDVRLHIEGDEVWVPAGSSVAADLAAALLAEYDDVRLLAFLLDADVLERRQRFQADLVSHGDQPGWPPFVLDPRQPLVPGQCFSCGTPLPWQTCRRCWRCALAWRLAVLPDALPAPAVAAALDAARPV